MMWGVAVWIAVGTGWLVPLVVTWAVPCTFVIARVVETGINVLTGRLLVFVLHGR